MWCKECEQECEVHVVDFGWGRGEFWGQPYNDVNKQEVSVCCDGDLLWDDPAEDRDPPDSNTVYDFTQRLIEAQKLK